MDSSSPQTPFFRPVQQALIVLLITISIGAIIMSLYSARWIVLATLIGVGLGVIISPIMTSMKRHLKIPQGISAFLFFILFIATFVALGYMVYVLVAKDFAPLVTKFPQIFDQARERISEMLGRAPELQRHFERIEWGAVAKNSAQAVLAGLQFGATALGGFFFVLTIALYLAVSPLNYLAGALSLFPAHMRQRAKEVMFESAATLRKWFLAQLIAMISVGALTALGLLAIGVDHWLVLGTLTAALDFLPYLGPLLAAAVAMVITLGSEPDKVWWVMGIYFIAQNVESDLIIPLVMKGRIRLPPIHLITLMLVFGSWFGIIGVFITPPLFAVARTIYLMTYVPRMNRRIRSPDAPLKKSA